MADSSKKMQIVFASAECAPFVKTGGLGDVAGSLPAALVRAGAEVIVMVPKYATIKDEYKEHFADFYVSLGWRNEYCGLEKLEHDGVTYMFVDNERYFARDYPYGFFDDGERFAFFSKAITESLQHLPEGFECDILHCNDWQTALAPVFLREFYQGLPLYDRVKTVFSIHNVAFQGQFSDTVMEDILGVAHIPAAASQLRCDACSINYMLGALRYADAITTVSPTYANEIQTPEFGEGLDGVLRERSYALQGILNGIDVAGFDPATDKRIAANYTVDDRAGKAVCKAKLQEELGLEVRDDRPLMVMVTRLTRQKGMDLVMYALDRILAGGVQVAVLGTGDRDYEDGLRYWAEHIVSEGVTSFLATTITQSVEVLTNAVTNVANVMESGYDGAEILGIHFEGPYLDMKYKGAQPDQYIVKPTIEQFEHYQKAARGHIRYVTLATEHDEDFALTRYLTAHGVVVSIGHSGATYEQAVMAYANGARSMTHVYNGMSPFNHRANGLVGAAYRIRTMYGEIICDGCHSTPAALNNYFMSKGPDYAIMVSDALMAKGTPVGSKYLFGGNEIIIYPDGSAHLTATGGLAGSTLNINKGLRILVEEALIPFNYALNSCTINPAKCLHLDDRKGSIQVGKDADLVVLEDNYDVLQTYCMGQPKL